MSNFAGMNEAGLAECIVRAVNACEPELHALLYQRYVLLTVRPCDNLSSPL